MLLGGSSSEFGPLAHRRSKFAAVWLNEEWFTERRGGEGHYAQCLDTLLIAYAPKVDVKDRSLSTFLTSIPQLPSAVFTLLELLSEDTERSIVGFLALRDLIESRPPVRDQALGILLQLCTHSDRKTRVMAISTVRRWVPTSPMASKVVRYALGVIRRLVPADAVKEKVAMPLEIEDGEAAEEEVEAIQSRFLPDVVEADNVQQHVELLFALSRRQQDLLDDIFRLYPKMPPPIQESLETLLTPLIQSLGATDKLLQILRNFPAGADRLALRIVIILCAEGASPALVGLLKGLMTDRELDPRFIIPIIGELDKVSRSQRT